MIKVLVHRYNSICEPDYIEAFEKLGLEVIEDTTEITRKEISSSERMERLAELVLVNKPVFVFTINFFPYISDICERMGVLYISVTVDCPVTEIYDKAIQNSHNRVFLFDRYQYDSIKGKNSSCIFHLPLGGAVERISKKIEMYDNLQYKYDISLVASLYNEKDPYGKIEFSDYDKGYYEGLLSSQGIFEGLNLLDECITDSDIEKLKEKSPEFCSNIPEYPVLSQKEIESIISKDIYLGYHLSSCDRINLLNELAKQLPEYDIHLFTRSDVSDIVGVECHDGISTLNEMPGVFRLSKININPTIRSIRTGLPQRIWDVMASGGFLLTNYQSEINDYFIPGVHLETYSSIEELIEKCRYYMKNDDERERISTAGYEEVKRNGTVFLRVQQMLKIALQ